MVIEVDQSGKLEKTSIPTVIAFSNGVSKSAIISSTEKQKLENHFRLLGKRRVYVYQSFATILFLLLKDEKKVEEVVIDTEYPGQAPLIKNILLNLAEKKLRIDKRDNTFKQIGKKSNAHNTAYLAYKSGSATITLTAIDIIKHLPQTKKSG
ncbi:MAG: hypothetical protein AAB563_01340 [Patescibacteria group bacterium]